MFVCKFCGDEDLFCVLALTHRAILQERAQERVRRAETACINVSERHAGSILEIIAILPTPTGRYERARRRMGGRRTSLLAYGISRAQVPIFDIAVARLFLAYETCEQDCQGKARQDSNTRGEMRSSRIVPALQSCCS